MRRSALSVASSRKVGLAGALCAAVLLAATFSASPARALSIKPICNIAGWVNGLVGKACTVIQNAPKLAKADSLVRNGKFAKAAKTVLGSGGSAASGVASKAGFALGLAAVGAWVLGGAKFALHETAKVLSETTSPQLRSTWFSSEYWRMAGIAAVLTLPFLFAAAIQALMRSDLSLLARAAFGYLPLAMLAVGIAAPLTMLLLAVSDQMSAVVSSAAGDASLHFLERAGAIVGVLSVFSGSPFLAFLVGIFTASAALVLWLELLVREAAVYVIVLMLPLAFAALAWPARRIWAIRAVELLFALILSKFAIVAVLSLGGAAFSKSLGAGSITGAVGGGALVLMAAFAPWALLRLLPLTELAAGAAGPLRGEASTAKGTLSDAQRGENRVTNWLASMRSDAEESGAISDGADLGTTNGTVGDELASIVPRDSDQPLNGATAHASDGSEAAAGGVGRTGAGDGVGHAHGASRNEADDATVRSPGMDDLWQAEDFAWDPLPLGFDADSPPEVWSGRGLGRATEEGPARGETPPPPPAQRPADEPDPRPAEQPRSEGHL